MAEEIQSLKVSVEIDDSKLKRGVQQTTKTVDKMGQSFEAVGDDIQKVVNTGSQGFTLLTSRLNSLRGTLGQVSKQFTAVARETFGDNIAKSLSGIAEQSKIVSSNTNRMTGEFSALGGKAATVATLGTSFTTLAVTMKESLKNLTVINDEFANMQTELTQSVGSMTRFGLVSRRVIPTIEKQKSTQAKLSEEVKRAQHEFNNLERALNNLPNQINRVNRGFSSMKTLLGGLAIAKTIQTLTQGVRTLVGDTYSFGNAVENVRRSFTVLLGDTEKANTSVEFLKQFAADTATEFETAAANARQLLSYGFKFENLAYVMGTVADATAAAGDPQAFERISRALGQMLAKGTVQAEEMQQLMEAGIPAATILAETLGLSSKEIANIGKLGLESGQVVNALLSGMEKRFGGLSKEMAQTIPSMLTSIRTMLAEVGTELSKGLRNSFTSFLKDFTASLRQVMQILRTEGIGGVLDKMFAPEDAARIRQMVAYALSLKDAFTSLWASIQPIVAIFVQFGITIGNIVLPVLTGILQILSGIIQILSPFNEFIVGAIATLAGFSIVTKVIQGLVALKVAIASVGAVIAGSFLPWVAAAVGALLLLDKLLGGRIIKSISNFTNGIAQAFGIGTRSVLQPELKNVSQGFSDMDSKIIKTNSSLKDTDKSAKKAGKALKGLLQSFDEVYNIPDEMEDATGKDDIFQNIIPTIPEITLPEVSVPSDWHLELPEVDTSSASSSIGRWLAESGRGLKNWWSQTVSGFKEWWGQTASGFATWTEATEKTFGDWWGRTKTTFKDWAAFTRDTFGDWWSRTKTGFMDWVSYSGDMFTSWKDLTSKTFSDWWDRTINIFKPWWADTTALFADWKNLTFKDIWNWTKETASTLSTWVADTVRTLGGWVSQSMGIFLEWSGESIKRFGSWVVDSLSTFSNWVVESAKIFGGWVIDTGKTFGGWIVDSAKSFGGWAADTGKVFADWFHKTLISWDDWSRRNRESTIKWAQENELPFVEWSVRVIGVMADWARAAYDNFGAWISNTKTSFINWKDGIVDTFVSWKDAIVDVFTGLWDSVKDIWNKLFGKNQADFNVSVGVKEKQAITAGTGISPMRGDLFRRETLQQTTEAEAPVEARGRGRSSIDSQSQQATPTMTTQEVTNYNTTLQVGTLIGDDKGMRELQRRLNLIQEGEARRTFAVPGFTNL